MLSLAGIGIIAFLLKLAGTLWIISGVILFFVAETWKAPPSPQYGGVGLTNTVILTVVTMVVGWLLVGLFAIGAGYALNALYEIAFSLQRRRTARPPTTFSFLA